MTTIESLPYSFERQHIPTHGPVVFKVRGVKCNIAGIYQGASAFLLCGGPSLKLHDLNKLRTPGILTMGMNNSPAIYRPNLWTCADSADRFLRSIWLDPSIMKFIPEQRRSERIYDSERGQLTDKVAGDCPNVWVFPRHLGFTPESFFETSSISFGLINPDIKARSVMLQAVRLLYELGFRTIYLLGADFRMDPGNEYGYDQPRGRKDDHSGANNRLYGRLNQMFTDLVPYMDERGLKVYNCTPDSGLTAFPYVDFDCAVEMALSTHVLCR